MVTVVRKPWGREILYALGPGYAGKIIVVEKGRRLSLQYHARKHETIYVLAGRLVLRLGGRQRVLGPGKGAVIPPKTVHRFEARFGRVRVLEASTTELKDVVRLEDDFDRAPTAEGGCDRARVPAAGGRARKWLEAGRPETRGRKAGNHDRAKRRRTGRKK